MIEYAYCVNTPKLSEMLRPEVMQWMFPKNVKRGIYTFIDPEPLLRPEYKHYHGMDFNHGVFFLRTNGHQSLIHRDLTAKDDPEKLSVWALNFVQSGHGTMGYWEESDFPTGSKKIMVDSQGSQIIWFENIVPPRRVYPMIAGRTYLVNTTALHSATGYNGRYILSLRDSWLFSILWPDVVEWFQDIIIPWSDPILRQETQEVFSSWDSSSEPFSGMGQTE